MAMLGVCRSHKPLIRLGQLAEVSFLLSDLTAALTKACWRKQHSLGHGVQQCLDCWDGSAHW